MKEITESIESQLSKTAKINLERLLIYSLEQGEPPFDIKQGLLPKDLEPAYAQLIAEISSMSFDRTQFDRLYPPEVFVVMSLISQKRHKQHLQSSLDFDYFINEINKRNPILLKWIIKDGDDQGMICTEYLNRNSQWYSNVEKAVFIHEAKLGSCNSVLPLSRLLGKSDKIFIRPDCFKLLESDKYYEKMEKAGVYGKPFNQTWLDTFKGVQSAAHYDDKSNPLITGDWTEFVWEEMSNDEVQFSCEEIPSHGIIENISDFNVTRFMHGIYDRKTKTFNHLDGALHIYTRDEYTQRMNLHLKEHFNTYRKTKIFRIDETLTLEQSQMLIEAFYRWNYLVPEYFSDHTRKRSST